jgi:hypothetical protein
MMMMKTGTESSDTEKNNDEECVDKIRQKEQLLDFIIHFDLERTINLIIFF